MNLNEILQNVWDDYMKVGAEERKIKEFISWS